MVCGVFSYRWDQTNWVPSTFMLSYDNRLLAIKQKDQKFAKLDRRRQMERKDVFFQVFQFSVELKLNCVPGSGDAWPNNNNGRGENRFHVFWVNWSKRWIAQSQISSHYPAGECCGSDDDTSCGTALAIIARNSSLGYFCVFTWFKDLNAPLVWEKCLRETQNNLVISQFELADDPIQAIFYYFLFESRPTNTAVWCKSIRP